MCKTTGKMKKAISWYIKGSYHCDMCPMCWSEWSYESGDGDAGCYIFGDIRDSCRLIPPLRQLVGWPRKKKAEYWSFHQYDNFDEMIEEEKNQDAILEKILANELQFYEFCSRGEDMQLEPVYPCKGKIIENLAMKIRMEYEWEAHPYVYTSLSQEWKNVLHRTWNSFLDVFRPFLPQKKNPKKKPEIVAAMCQNAATNKSK